MILKIGSKGDKVKELQSFLGLKEDGVFGKKTYNAVKVWQKANKILPVDGIVGPLTWNAMEIVTTDLSETLNHDIEFNNIISYLPKGEYISGKYNKRWIFLHHTAGWNNPFKTVTNWANDNRGPVATEFVLGGQSVKGNSNKYDGTLVKDFPDGAFGWHLGIGNTTMHRESVGIETCNFGQLTKGGYYKKINNKKVWIEKSPNSYYTYVGIKVVPNQVTILKKPFRGYSAWHKYTTKQITVLKELILDISKRDNIDITKGLPELIKNKGAFEAFDFCDVNYVAKHPGIWCHANVKRNKFDMFPQPELVNMLLSLFST